MSAEFGASFLERKLLVDRGPALISLGYTSGHVGGELVLGEDDVVQTLAGDGREFEFGHVELGGILGV